ERHYGPGAAREEILDPQQPRKHEQQRGDEHERGAVVEAGPEPSHPSSRSSSACSSARIALPEPVRGTDSTAITRLGSEVEGSTPRSSRSNRDGLKPSGSCGTTKATGTCPRMSSGAARTATSAKRPR